jgi:hypothetical protein
MGTGSDEQAWCRSTRRQGLKDHHAAAKAVVASNSGKTGPDAPKPGEGPTKEECEAIGASVLTSSSRTCSILLLACREAVLSIDQALHVAGTIQINSWRADTLRSIVEQLCSIAEALHE